MCHFVCDTNLYNGQKDRGGESEYMIVEKGRTIGRTERKDKNEIMEGQKSVFRGGLQNRKRTIFFASDTKNGQ